MPAQMNLKGKNILITAGPTREYIDPVRFISNDSSGAMGFALAEAAKKMGAKVTLISGPVTVSHLWSVKPHSRGVKRLEVVSAREMYAAVKKYYKHADVIICAAAVADWRPAKYSKQKIKKTTSTLLHSNTSTLQLTPNPDILAWLGCHKKREQCLIGFALETEHVVKNAIKKLRDKNCDIIVANHAISVGAQRTSATIISKNGAKKSIINRTKQNAAQEILKTAERCAVACKR